MILNTEFTEVPELAMKPIHQPTERIIGAAIMVQREKGPGLLESAYEVCLAYELESLVLHSVRQVAVPLVVYKGITRLIDDRLVPGNSATSVLRPSGP
jgi:hypothetical protein